MNGTKSLMMILGALAATACGSADPVGLTDISLWMTLRITIEPELTPELPGWLYDVRVPAGTPYEAVVCEAQPATRDHAWSSTPFREGDIGGPWPHHAHPATTPEIQFWVTLSSSIAVNASTTYIVPGDLYGLSQVVTASVPCDRPPTIDEHLPCYTTGVERKEISVHLDRVFEGCPP